MDSKAINFGVWESIGLLINTLCSRIFLNYPRSMIETAGNAAWIEVLYAAALIFIFFAVISKLFSNFSGMDLIDIGEYAFGSFGRIFIGLSIIILFVYITPVILREYSEDMKIIALPTSPISFVMLFFLIPMIIGSYLGIEAIIRFHSLVVPIISIAYLIIMFGVIKYYDFGNFYPILGKGADKIFISGFFSVTVYGPILYLFLITPFIKTHKNFKKIGYISLGISSFYFLVSILVFIAVIPVSTGIELFIPVFQLARLVNYGMFLQRIESLFMLSWATSALMYLSAILFFLVYIFQKTFKLMYYKPLILPFAVIIFSLSILPSNLMTAIALETKYYSAFGWIVTLLIPLLLLLISSAKKKYGK